MAEAIYDPRTIASSRWWIEEPSMQPDEWRGRLAILYIRAVVGLLGLVPSKKLNDPDIDWKRVRRIFAKVDSLAAVLPREIARAQGSGVPVPSEWFAADGRLVDDPQARTILYVHGGSYVLERTKLHDVLAANLANEADARVLAVDYRLAPEHPFPHAISDVLAAWQHLIDHGTPPERIAFAGDSAGGGLALAALVALRDADGPMPAAFVAMSPWADLTFSGASIITNASRDPFMSDVEFVSICADLYLQGHSPRDPLASPALADLHGLPPTLVHVGTSDLLLDDSRRIVSAIRAGGGKARLDIWRNMPHVWQRLASFIPEASCSLSSIGQFLRAAIPDREMAEPPL